MPTCEVKFLGHASVLIKGNGLSLVIDPNFSDRILTLPRTEKASFDPHEMQAVDVIAISNAHHHRLDTRSLKYFKQSTQMIMPVGLGKLVNTYFHFCLTELRDGAQKEVGELLIMAKKARHRGFRKSGLTFPQALHYVIKLAGQTIFYCSDTRYDGGYFFDLGKELNFDLAILPIDYVGPDLTARNRYLTQATAIHAFQDLKAKNMLSVGYGAFSFSHHSKESVLSTLSQEIEKHGLKAKVTILNPGESLHV